MTKNSFPEVDIKKILHDKSPKAAKWIPGFIIRYLRKIGREDGINEIIREYGHLRGFDFSEAMIKHFDISINIEGEENLPKDGKYIFVSNHPLGGFDGHILMYILGQRYDSYKFLVNDILMNLTNMSDVFIPVNKHGRQGAKLAEQLDEAYNSDSQILSFPAGLVSRKIDGVVMDLEWQKNFIAKSKQYKRNVIPIHISGGNTKFFYRLSNFRKRLGIKLNIEMLYLVDETFRHQGKEFTVTFGEPISYETFDKTKRPKAWAAWVKDIVYTLPNKK